MMKHWRSLSQCTVGINPRDRRGCNRKLQCHVRLFQASGPFSIPVIYDYTNTSSRMEKLKFDLTVYIYALQLQAGLSAFEDAMKAGFEDFKVSTHSIFTQSTVPTEPYFPPPQQICELLSIGGTIVAFGTVLMNRDENLENAYKIIVGDIHDRSVELFGVSGKTFDDDIEVGYTIQWLKALTRFI